MGLFEPTILNFDVYEITRMRSKIQETSIELAEFKNTLLLEMEVLKEQWKTPAGKKFMEELDNDWVKQVDSFIKITGAVSELLEVAESNYMEVEEEVKKITF